MIEQKQCATCRHWQAVEKNDIAGCECPVPEWVEDILNWEDVDRDNSIAGDHGVDCPCWEDAS